VTTQETVATVLGKLSNAVVAYQFLSPAPFYFKDADLVAERVYEHIRDHIVTPPVSKDVGDPYWHGPPARLGPRPELLFLDVNIFMTALHHAGFDQPDGSVKESGFHALSESERDEVLELLENAWRNAFDAIGNVLEDGDELWQQVRYPSAGSYQQAYGHKRTVFQQDRADMVAIPQACECVSIGELKCKANERSWNRLWRELKNLGMKICEVNDLTPKQRRSLYGIKFEGTNHMGKAWNSEPVREAFEEVDAYRRLQGTPGCNIVIFHGSHASDAWVALRLPCVDRLDSKRDGFGSSRKT